MKKYNWFILHGINNKTFDAMSTLNFKDSILKRYYIFDWNGKDCFVEVSAKVRGSLLQMFLKMDVLKNSGIFTGKFLSWSLFLIKFITL